MTRGLLRNADTARAYGVPKSSVEHSPSLDSGFAGSWASGYHSACGVLMKTRDRFPTAFPGKKICGGEDRDHLMRGALTLSAPSKNITLLHPSSLHLTSTDYEPARIFSLGTVRGPDRSISRAVGLRRLPSITMQGATARSWRSLHLVASQQVSLAPS